MTRLDRAAHLRQSSTTLADALRSEATQIVPVWRNRNLIAKGRPARPVLLSATDASGLIQAGGALVWLGLLDDAHCFALDVSPSEDTLRKPILADAGEFNDLRMVGTLLAAEDAELLAYARGMLHWHRHHQHCARCGARTTSIDGGHVRHCAPCDKKHFPRTDPAVMALVLHEDSCLLARQPSFPQGMYSVLAGFVEPGESLEQAVIREVHEEVGLSVGEVRYLKSQPWPFPSSLMLGFVAFATDENIRIDDDELEDARWFTRAQIRSPDSLFIPPPYSLANQLISAFLDSEV